MKRTGANIDFIIFYFTVTGLFGYVFQYKDGRTGPAGPVLARSLFQCSKKVLANQKSNAWLGIGLTRNMNLEIL